MPVVMPFAMAGISDMFLKDRKIVMKFNSVEPARYIMRYRTLLRITNDLGGGDGVKIFTQKF